MIDEFERILIDNSPFTLKGLAEKLYSSKGDRKKFINRARMRLNMYHAQNWKRDRAEGSKKRGRREILYTYIGAEK